MTTLTRRTAFLLGTAAILALAGCTSAGSVSGDSAKPTAEAAPPAAKEPSIVCPEGFTDAYAAQIAESFAGDVVVAVATADEFAPEFLVPFLDGACAIHITGSAIIGEGTTLPADAYTAVSPDASIADAVGAAFEAEGYTPDPEYPSNYANAAESRFGLVLAFGPDFGTNGEAALEQYFPGGLVFQG